LPEKIKPLLCYVTSRKAFAGDDSARLAAVLPSIRAGIAAGIDWIQIREKDLPGRELELLAEQAVAAAHGSGTRIIVNNRLDVAVAAGAAGVHLGGESLPVADVVNWLRRSSRHALGGRSFSSDKTAEEQAGASAPEARRFLVGASCHSLADAQTAERDGADYIFFGPVFPTPEKLRYGPPQGIERLVEVCRAVRIPVLAIGGITTRSAAECLRAGAAGIAAIRLFQDAADVVELVRDLRT